MEIEFEWDENKNAINQKKHGVSFEEAKTCFEDDHARVFYDVEHSQDEDRSILIGMSPALRTLVVVYTERIVQDEIVVNRIISARKATKKEFRYYWNARKEDGL